MQAGTFFNHQRKEDGHGVNADVPDAIMMGNMLVNDAETPVNRIAEGVTLVGNIGIS